MPVISCRGEKLHEHSLMMTHMNNKDIGIYVYWGFGFGGGGVRGVLSNENGAFINMCMVFLYNF